jgi:hypothetical protein
VSGVRGPRLAGRPVMRSRTNSSREGREERVLWRSKRLARRSHDRDL